MMNRRIWLAVAIALVAGLPLLAAEPAPSNLEKLATSEAKWKEMRDTAKGEYTYQVQQVFFIGRNETTIKVRDGKVVERSFIEMGNPEPLPPGVAPPDIKPKWIETDQEISSHKESAPAKTIDELYVEAAKVLKLALEPHERLYLGFSDQGILSHCFVVDTRIADDAPQNGVGPIKLVSPAK